MKSNGKFWADASKKTGTWAGVAAVAVPLFDWLNESLPENWEHVVIVGLMAALRAILALAQGNVGDRSKASFAPASGPSIEVPASGLRSPVPDSAPAGDPEDE